jgi:dipeptidase D
MNRLLLDLTKEYKINVASVDGGSLRNAIPRESVAVIAASTEQVEAVKARVGEFAVTYKEEYGVTDPGVQVTIEQSEAPAHVMDMAVQEKLLRSIYTCPNGIYRMSPDIEGLVQTSNNVARVIVKDGSYSVQCLSRSSVDSEKTDLVNAICSAFELMDATATFGGAYPGWKPKPEAPIVQLMADLYKELYKEPAHVSAVHAGLECGIIGRNYPEIQMISFGPNIYGAHSPDERAQISSVQKFWNFLLETLKRVPVNS